VEEYLSISVTIASLIGVHEGVVRAHLNQPIMEKSDRVRISAHHTSASDSEDTKRQKKCTRSAAQANPDLSISEEQLQCPKVVFFFKF
jgi:hypothetical protein